MFLFANINKKLEEFQNTPGAVLVDVREADEFRSGHIPGAINQPLSTISRIDQAEEAAERLGDVTQPLRISWTSGRRQEP